MSLLFPSQEFDEAVAAVCHGQASDEQARALNELLRVDAAARDEYLLRVELHTRLASDAELFAAAAGAAAYPDLKALGSARAPNTVALPQRGSGRRPVVNWAIGLAACFLILAALSVAWFKRSSSRKLTSMAVAMLSQAVSPRWNSRADARAVGTALEPGWLRLKSGLVQATFYSGTRLVVEGPAQVRLVSPGEAFCEAGRIVAVVPAQARGFRMGTPQIKVTDLGTEFGLDVKRGSAEVHVFKGEVVYQAEAATKQNLKQGKAIVVDSDGVERQVSADPAAFASLFGLERKWLAALDQRYKDWRTASARRNLDPSLLAHFDFEDIVPSEWTLHNVASWVSRAPDATIVGCQVTEGRWPGKRALEYRSMSDRVRLNVPGEFQALTLAVWVNVKGLDRQFNSLFMCDGFDPGTLHWQIRNNGALDLGVQGPRATDVQIFASPPVVGLNQFGQWLYLATVVDGKRRRVIHYVNGTVVSQHELKHPPPYRVGTAELGNWNPGEIPDKPPFLIRHFSGAMDEFALFNRALSDAEIRALYFEGKPQPDN
jgi:hypothetical protein